MELKDFRKRLKLNQQEMAKEINVSVSYYCKVEKGFQNPSFEFLKKLKGRFKKINIDEVFFKTKRP